MSAKDLEAWVADAVPMCQWLKANMEIAANKYVLIGHTQCRSTATHGKLCSFHDEDVARMRAWVQPLTVLDQRPCAILGCPNPPVAVINGYPECANCISTYWLGGTSFSVPERGSNPR